MVRGFALAAALMAGFALFWVGAVTPGPSPTDAPAADFSAGRAMADVRALGSLPHPVGSPANDRVREALVARMRALGLEPRVRRAVAFASYGADLSGATVDNVIGVLPGRDRAAPALVLMAHHDSVPGSPGAADDTAGVAAALEVVRAIEVRGSPLRDVLLVITDGEEAGLLGARAFFDEDPAAAHVGYVLNLETRGGGGRAMMFETAPGNGADVALYRRTALAPVSNALTVFVYRHMPNDTDFTVALAHGKAGLNYAFIGRQFDYHSPSATPRALDQGALQHMGAQVLPTATALAFGPLPGRAPDVVYGNLVGDLTAAYPAAFGWGVIVACAGLIAAGAARAGRRAALFAPDIARGVGTSLYILTLAAVLLELARKAVGAGFGWMDYRPILARFPAFEVMMLAAALGAILLTAAFAARGRVRILAVGVPLAAGILAGPLSRPDLAALALGGLAALTGALTFGAPGRAPGTWTGLLLTALVGAVAVQVAAPTAGAVIAWPLLAAALAFALSAGGVAGGMLVLAATAVVAALALAWLGALFHQLLQGLDLPPLAAVPAWLAALVVWPLVFPGSPERARPFLRATPILAALVLAAWLRFDDPWTARYPRAVEPVFVVDPAAHRAWRASLQTPDAWTLAVLGADGGRPMRLALPFLRHPVIAASATPPALASVPSVTRAIGADGRLIVTAAPHPGAAQLWIALRAPEALAGVSVNGRPAHLAAPAGVWARLQWAGREPLVLGLPLKDPSRLEVVAGERFDRWMAATPLPPTPPNDQLWDIAGSTLVVGRPPP
jgi:hypothetical protein